MMDRAVSWNGNQPIKYVEVSWIFRKERIILLSWNVLKASECGGSGKFGEYVVRRSYFKEGDCTEGGVSRDGMSRQSLDFMLILLMLMRMHFVDLPSDPD